jgi:hypothetical protein
MKEGAVFKRVVAGTVGIFAILAACVSLLYALDAASDFKHAEQLRWADVLGILLIWSITLTAFGMGVRFLRFAWSNANAPIKGRLGAFLLGLGFFFPGFIFSLPVTLICAWRLWPGNLEKEEAALRASSGIGIVAAIICFAILLRKRSGE